MMSLPERREANKRAHKAYLKQLNASPQFQSFLTSRLGSDAYSLRQYEARYKHQCLQILSYQFSSMGGTNQAKILQLSVQDYYDALCADLDHLQLTGLGVVVLDARHEVCMVFYGWDQADLPPAPARSIQNIDAKLSKLRKKHELFSAVFARDPLYKRHIIAQQPLEYGRVLYSDKVGYQIRTILSMR